MVVITQGGLDMLEAYKLGVPIYQENRHRDYPKILGYYLHTPNGEYKYFTNSEIKTMIYRRAKVDGLKINNADRLVRCKNNK